MKYIIQHKVWLLMCIALFISGCAGIYRKIGDAEFEERNLHQAAKYYEKALAKSTDYQTRLKLANVHYLLDNTTKAEPLYKNITDSSAAGADEFLRYAKVLMSNGKYVLAKSAFVKYSAMKPDDGIAKMLALACDSAILFSSASPDYILTNEYIGGFQLQLGLAPYKEGVVFSASKAQIKNKKDNFGSDDSYLDMYFMRKDSTGWSAPEPLNGDVNGPYHEGPAAFSGDTLMYFTRSNYQIRKLKRNEENVNTLKIFRASLINGKWKNQKELSFTSSEYSCGHPCLTEDGKKMFFISDMPGGFGETDIYVSTFENGDWSKPMNLGPEVNTKGKELFPYVQNDTLYFSSDAHASIGGLDIFMSHFSGTRWSAAKNLGAPVNSSKDDFAFVQIKNTNKGYVCSNRNGIADNVFSVTKKKKELLLDSLSSRLYALIKVNDTLYIPLVKRELLSISTAGEIATLLSAEEKMIRMRSIETEKGYAVTLKDLIVAKMLNEQKSVLTRIEEIRKKQKEVMAQLPDTLALRFFSLIHAGDTLDMPLIKDELRKASTKKELLIVLESERKMLKNRTEATEKNYAASLSTLVKRKKEVEGIDILARVEERKRNRNVIAIKTVGNKNRNISSKKSSPTSEENGSIAYNEIKPKKRKEASKKIRKPIVSTSREDEELQTAIAEIEQLYTANGSDPRSLLNEAKNRNEIVMKSLLTKDKAERERILMLWRKTIANNLAMKYSQGNPLTDLLDIIDAHDKKLLYQKYDTTKIR